MSMSLLLALGAIVVLLIWLYFIWQSLTMSTTSAPRVEAPKVAVPNPAPFVAPAPEPARAAPLAKQPAPRTAAPAKPKAVSKAAAPVKAKAVPKPKAAPAPKAKAAAVMTAIGVPGAVGAPDSLLQLKGVGPKLNTLLVGLGITRFDQIAAWSASDVAKVDDHLGTFKGRIGRDSWVEQAGLLATGRVADFEAKFGKLDSENA
jgi:predicted flap endonuclease-1-like 5' DNA nuclease